MVSPEARRGTVKLATARGMSQRKACALFSVPRSTLGYTSVLDEKDAPLLDRMAALAKANPRYGYRRVRALLSREGQLSLARRLGSVEAPAQARTRPNPRLGWRRPDCPPIAAQERP